MSVVELCGGWGVVLGALISLLFMAGITLFAASIFFQGEKKKSVQKWAKYAMGIALVSTAIYLVLPSLFGILPMDLQIQILKTLGTPERCLPA